MADRIEHPDEERDVTEQPDFVQLLHRCACDYELSAFACDTPLLARYRNERMGIANDLRLLSIELTALRQQLTEAQADRERLDWLDATCAGITHVPLCSNYPAFWAVDPNEDASEYLGEGFTIREALDAARLASSSESGT